MSSRMKLIVILTLLFHRTGLVCSRKGKAEKLEA